MMKKDKEVFPEDDIVFVNGVMDEDIMS